MNIANNIKLIRNQKGLSQATLAALVGVDRSAVAQWENGIAFPRKQHLIHLAEVLETTPAALVGNASNEAAFIPLIDTSGELTGESLEVPVGLFERHPRARALVMPDNGMANLFTRGLAVIHDPTLEPTNGQIAAILYEGHVLVRHLFYGSNTIMLTSDSFEDCPDVIVTDPDSLRVLGLVIWVQSAHELQ